ncbi:MAG: flippase-like domain-containing protein [Acidobacteria bacterium]|nr:flippase-like domain-containing protein [Acidobacteriota bacterium]
MILRWLLLLRASEVAISTAAAARLFLVSSFVGSFLPAGVGGDAARAYGLTRVASTGSEALASVAVDRVLGVLALLALGVVGFLVWSPHAATDWRAPVAITLLATACVAAFWTDRLVRVVLPLSLHGTVVGRRVLAVGDAVSRYRDRPAAVLHVMAWSIVVQLLRVAQAYLLGLGLGLAVPLGYYLVFMPIGLLMLLLPVSISGFGLPQGVIVWLLRPMGVADERSFALSTLIVLTGLAGNVPGLFLWLRQRREIL